MLEACEQEQTEASSILFLGLLKAEQSLLYVIRVPEPWKGSHPHLGSPEVTLMRQCA